LFTQKVFSNDLQQAQVQKYPPPNRIEIFLSRVRNEDAKQSFCLNRHLCNCCFDVPPFHRIAMIVKVSFITSLQDVS